MLTVAFLLFSLLEGQQSGSVVSLGGGGGRGEHARTQNTHAHTQNKHTV